MRTGVLTHISSRGLFYFAHVNRNMAKNRAIKNGRISFEATEIYETNVPEVSGC